MFDFGNNNKIIVKFVFKNKFLCLALCCTFFFAYRLYYVFNTVRTRRVEQMETGSTGFEKLDINGCTFDNLNRFYPKRTNDDDDDDDDGQTFLRPLGILPKTIELSSVNVFYREAKPFRYSKGDVLLLHGAAFSSEIWARLGIMQLLATSGFRVVAIDQPGFNRNTNGSYDSDTFLSHLCTKLNLTFPALISPSASGRFSVPFVVSGLAGAFIPVAPCCTNKFTIDYWKNVTTPTLILHGESDKAAPSKFLLATPNHVLRIIKSAGHSVYVDQTKLFNTLILNFLNFLTTKKSHLDLVDNQPKRC